MKRVIVQLLIVCMFATSIMSAGCANIKDDRTRTQTEGGLVGAGAGAAVGAGIGAALGGRRGALIGGLIGLVAGGIAGTAYGTHVANKKEAYASEEAWLEACLDEAQQQNAALKEQNEKMVAEIKRVDNHTAALKKSYDSRLIDKKALRAETKRINKSISANQEFIQRVDFEIENQQLIAQELSTNVERSDESALIEAEIAELKRQKEQLEETNEQLAAMSSRISV